MFATVVIFIAILPQFSYQHRITMSVYYESLCGDSIDFIKNQLAPNYDSIKKYVDVDFIPYGKARHSYYYDEWEFNCQHGPKECKGNKLQACGLQLATSRDDKFNFVNCCMSSRTPASSTTVKKCAESNGIDWERLKTCYNSDEGNRLLAYHGYRTYDVQPSISFIPTIVFNGVYSDYLQSRALVDLKETVRSYVQSLLTSRN